MTRRATGGDAHHRWEMATRPVPPALAPYVRAWVGYDERSDAPLTRRELPGTRIVAIVELGPPLRLHHPHDQARPDSFDLGFAAGLGQHATLTRHDGHQRCVQLDLTPAGARLLFDVPLSELTDRVVGLGELLPGQASLGDALAALPDWEARLAHVEDLVAVRIEAARARKRAPQVDVVAWACRWIERSGGRFDGRRLARELGYSQKHVIARFHDGVGVPPRQLARLVRFERLVRALRSGSGASWGELAFQLGFYDQAHLVREVRAFAGVTPTELRGALQVNPIQDAASGAP